jgi:predicted negative regulator of RcsB-dependent stress response
MDAKTLVIAVLVAAVGILGYLYWDHQENVLIKVPGVEIKKG